MKIALAGFAGEIPRTIPRLLGDSYAQNATNTKLEDGSLTPIRRGRFERRLDDDAQTIYKRGDEWLSWPGVVNVVPAPVAEDRLYVTGDGKPKLIVGDDIYDLAVPRPASKLSATINIDTEFVAIDGITFEPTEGLTGTTANGYTYTVGNVARTATIIITSTGMSAAAAAALVNSIGYSNTSADPTKGARTYTLTQIKDNGASNNTTTLALSSAVNVGQEGAGAGVKGELDADDTSGVDDPPRLVAKPLNPDYTSGVAYLFGEAEVSAVDAGQQITSLTFTVRNLVDGDVSEDLSQTIVYAYTNVTIFDEESEPSDLSEEMSWDDGLTVTLTGFSAPTGRVNRQRIYRSQTSALGVTGLFFIAEREASTLPFLDPSLPINEPIPSTSYNQPPDDLQGLISLPNGMMAAFSGKQICFCEPYIPHAWPEKYRLSVDYRPVGLGGFGSSMGVLTVGQPYVVTGTSPETMSMEKLELNLPCISARGIVDLGYTLAYPSHDGLVTLSSSGANVVSKQLMTRDQWLEMNPYSFVAGQFSGRYMASYAFSDADGVERRGIIIFDLSGSQPFKVNSADFADAMFYEIETGALYLLKNGLDIYEWDAQSQPFGEQTWLSKRFVLPTYTNFGVILIDGEDITSTGQRAVIEARNRAIIERNQAIIATGSIGAEMGSNALASIPFAGSLLAPAEDPTATLGVTIFADGKAVDFVTRTNEIVRLKSGFQARSWEIEVRGNVQVTAIVLANTPDEIAEG